MKSTVFFQQKIERVFQSFSHGSKVGVCLGKKRVKKCREKLRGIFYKRHR
jgi:hypothetical protein